VKHVTGRHIAADGVKLFTQSWLPEGEPRAAIFLTHGYAEHSGRYAHVAAYLAARGYAVYAMDLRGHGQSEGLRAHIDTFETYLADLYAYFKTLPVHRCFALGHSVGGVLALAFTARHQEDGICGVVTSGAALNAGDAVPGYLIAISRVLAALVPRLPILPLQAGDISKDPAVQAAYDADPLNYRGKVRAQMGRQILELARAVRREAGRITVPALVMHGGADRLISPTSADEIYALLGSADKTKRIYDGLYHEIFNEPERETVLADMAAWLDAHSAG